MTLGVRPDTTEPPRDPFAFYALPPTSNLAFNRAPVAGREWIRRTLYLGFALTQASRTAFDVVFTRDLTAASVVLRRPRASRPPVVFESHGYAPVFAQTLNELVSGASAGSSRKTRRLIARERRVWSRADGYVTTTRVLADELSARFGRRGPLATIPNGTPELEVSPFAFPAREATPVVAYAGHLYPWKGADVLIRALAQVTGVHGLIVGGHPRESDLGRVQALARDLGVADRVAFTGQVPVSEVSRHLERAHVLVLPTTDTPSARYTSPLKLFEYLAAGRPVVASDLAPIREIVTDGVSASLVKPADPEALAAGIRQVLDDRSLAERLATEGRRVAAGYTWDRRAEQLEVFLRTVTGAADRAVA